jgi:hypothetical protein
MFAHLNHQALFTDYTLPWLSAYDRASAPFEGAIYQLPIFHYPTLIIVVCKDSQCAQLNALGIVKLPSG